MEPWLEKLYKNLLDKFGIHPFSFDQATDFLQVEEKLNTNQVGVAISKLRKYGLIWTDQDPKDARKRIYKLTPQNERLEGIPSQNLGSPEQLAAMIFKAADLLRKRGGNRFLLLLLTYQFASEATKADDVAVRSKVSGSGPSRGKTNPDIFIQPGCRWDDLRKDPSRAVENLIRGLKAAVKHNPAIETAFPVGDFLRFVGKPENADAFKQFVELTGAVPVPRFDPSDASEPIEAILAQSALKKGYSGMYFVPRGLVQLLIELLDPQAGNSLFDACLGLGATLVACHHHFRNKYGEFPGGRLSFYGQEMDPKNLPLARQNLYFNGVTDVQLFSGNALLHPLQEGGKLKTFDLVVACPQWGGEGYPEGVIKKSEFWTERFRYGLPSRKALDGAWLQVALACTAEEGRAGVLLNSGFLSRGGREETVREGIVADDVLEAVILLPPKIIPFTGVPGSILVLNKRKSPQRRGRVIFIRAGNNSGRHPEVNSQGQLGEEERRRIIRAYRDFNEEEGFSRIVGRDEIQINGNSILPSVYIDISEKAVRADVLKAWERLGARDRALNESHARLEKILRDLGLLKAGKGEKP